MLIELEAVLFVQLVEERDVLADSWAHNCSSNAKEEHIDETVDPVTVEVAPGDAGYDGHETGERSDQDEL